jgi:hypothetical protein
VVPPPGVAVPRRGLSTLAGVQPPVSEELALAALEWVEASAVSAAGGVWWSSRPSSDEPDPGLYHGGAGIVLALLEAHAHFGDPRFAQLTGDHPATVAPAPGRSPEQEMSR